MSNILQWLKVFAIVLMTFITYISGTWPIRAKKFNSRKVF